MPLINRSRPAGRKVFQTRNKVKKELKKQQVHVLQFFFFKKTGKIIKNTDHLSFIRASAVAQG